MFLCLFAPRFLLAGFLSLVVLSCFVLIFTYARCAPCSSSHSSSSQGSSTKGLRMADMAEAYPLFFFVCFFFFLIPASCLRLSLACNASLLCCSNLSVFLFVLINLYCFLFPLPIAVPTSSPVCWRFPAFLRGFLFARGLRSSMRMLILHSALAASSLAP